MKNPTPLLQETEDPLTNAVDALKDWIVSSDLAAF